MPERVSLRLETSNDKSTHFRVVLLIFAALGFHVGVWAVLLADLSRSLGIGPAALGLALTCQSAAGVLFLWFGGRVADRLGRRPVLVAGASGTGGYLALSAFVGSYPALLAVLLFSGLASLYDLACNSLGGDYERMHGAKAMTLFHAGFSGSAALGALGSGAALGAGVGYETVYLLAGAAILSLALACLWLPLPGRAVNPEGDGGDGSARSLALLRVPTVFLCAAIIFMCFSTDAALEGYTSIYLREVLGAGALVGGAGLASLYFAGAVSRLLSAAAILRFGERKILVASGGVAALGLGAVVSTEAPATAALGLLLVGVALAPVAPIVTSLTARAAPANSGQAMSFVITSGYLAFTVSPVFTGTVADLSSLRVSFMLLLVLCAGVAFLAWRMPK
jgi:MFS family permease